MSLERLWLCQCPPGARGILSRSLEIVIRLAEQGRLEQDVSGPDCLVWVMGHWSDHIFPGKGEVIGLLSGFEAAVPCPLKLVISREQVQ
jgi:hypothetical protein